MWCFSLRLSSYLLKLHFGQLILCQMCQAGYDNVQGFTKKNSYAQDHSLKTINH